MNRTPPTDEMNRPSLPTAHEARVNELLKANTELMEEARDARRDRDKLQRALNQIIDRIGTAEIERVPPEAALFGEKPSKVLLDVLVERRRQRLHHGYNAAHDDEHTAQELLRSAASRILRRLADWNQALKPKLVTVAEAIRPWSETPTSHRQTLIQAAALVVAEVERHDRLLASFDNAAPSPHPRLPRCNAYLRGQRPPPAVPRTCAECGLGPCKFGLA